MYLVCLGGVLPSGKGRRKYDDRYNENHAVMSLIPSIEVNFDNLKNAKDAMRRMCSLLDPLINDDLQNSVTDIKKLWQDENCERYINDTQKIINMLCDIKKSIDVLVDEIEKEAVMVFDAELYGRGLAINTSY